MRLHCIVDHVLGVPNLFLAALLIWMGYVLVHFGIVHSPTGFGLCDAASSGLE